MLGVINSILNLASLLLWLGWLDAPVDTWASPPAASLVRTLRRVGPSKWARWKYLLGLLVLLVSRAFVYGAIGAAVFWSPAVSLDPIALRFRTELFPQMLAYSFLSFGLALGVFYLSLLLFSMLNARISDADPFQKFVRKHLGVVEGLPRAIKLFLPIVAGLIGWLVLAPILAHWQTIPSAGIGVRFRQGLVVGAGLFLLWKHVIAATLILHFLNNHIYFGSMALWNFITISARHLVAPLRRLPLRVRRIDYSPLVMVALVYIAGYIAEYGLKLHSGATVKVILPGLVDFFRWLS